MQKQTAGILDGPVPPSASDRGRLANSADVPEGTLDYALWLAEDVLLLVTQSAALRDLSLCAEIVKGEERLPVDACGLTVRRKDNQGTPLTIVLLQFPGAGAEGGGRILVQAGPAALAFPLAEIARREVALEVLTANVLTKLDAAGQAAVLETLASSLARRRGTAQDLWLSNRLFAIREALRPALPRSGALKEKPQGLCVDEFFALDDSAYYVRGWAHEARSRLARLSAVAPEGHRAELLERAFRHNRADLDKLYGLLRGDQSQSKDGFISYFETSFPSHLGSGWRVEMLNARGDAVEGEVREVVHDPEAAYKGIFAHLSFPWSTPELMSNHIYPALARLSHRCRQRLEIDEAIQFGPAVPAADVSIIIRLQTPASLEHQLLEFSRDSEIATSDLIYVLDGAGIAEDFGETASQLFQLHRVPFRTVTPKRTFSFIGVEEVGVSLARGRLLLFLDERVVPLRPGWLGELVSFHKSLPRPGAIAPRLVYENGCVHHAGLSFARSLCSGDWEPRPRFRGLHCNLPEVNRRCPVPALGKGCLLFGADAYQEAYAGAGVSLQGSYNDADFCLRLLETGRSNWYIPGTELFYASRPEAPAVALPGRDAFERWLFNHLWRQRLEQLHDETP